MSYNPPIVNISTPAKVERFSRGFYQLDEEMLYVPIYPGGQFYSFLDATEIDSNKPNDPLLNFDIDRAGNLTFIKLNLARAKWPVKKQIDQPATTLSAEVHFRQFREQISSFELVTNKSKDYLCLIFRSQNEPKEATEAKENLATYRIADNIIIELSAGAEISRLWILEIVEDRGARQMAAWRKKLRLS